MTGKISSIDMFGCSACQLGMPTFYIPRRPVELRECKDAESVESVESWKLHGGEGI